MAIRRFQFSLQSLFALVVLAAVGTAVYRWATMPTAIVTGSITFNGLPLAGGEIAFVNQGGDEMKCPIAANGQFEVRLMPGDYSVCVREPAGSTGGVPKQFGLATTSSLKFSARKGKNDLMFDLRP
jgi:hypothetical protein